MKTVDNEDGDPIAGALQVVAAVGDETATSAQELAKQSRAASDERANGATAAELMSSGRPQEILSLGEKMSKRLLAAGSGLRRALVKGLTKEGWGVGRISKLFGVSHQRISALLDRKRAKSN